MGFAPDASQRKAAREATDWLLLLNEQPDDKDLRRRFEAWHDASQLHAASWQSALRLSGALQQVAPVHAADWSQHPREPANSSAGASLPRPARGFFRRPVTMFVGAALAACIAALAAPSVLLQLRSDYTTATAELRAVTLEDGSEVVLAPRSAIAIDYTGRERRVELLEGAAFFSVAKLPERPFRVQAGSVQTTVLGTRFEVSRDDGAVRVSVEEGLVSLSDERQLSMKLAAGQSVRVDAKGLADRPIMPAVAAWRQNLLLADDRTVRDAVADLARYFPGTILIADGGLAKRRVTGVYGLSDPEASLRDIARVVGADVRRVSPWVLVISSK